MGFVQIFKMSFCVSQYFCRRRTRVCFAFGGYKYAGTSKSVAPDWNNKYINFVPFLCSLTVDLVRLLGEVCKLEAEGALLFQKPPNDVNEVSTISAFSVQTFPRTQTAIFFPKIFQALKLIGLLLDERPEPVKKSFERLHPKKK